MIIKNLISGFGPTTDGNKLFFNNLNLLFTSMGEK